MKSPLSSSSHLGRCKSLQQRRRGYAVTDHGPDRRPAPVESSGLTPAFA